jgi:hypothetical protein
MSDLESWVWEWKIKVNREEYCSNIHKKEASAQKQAQTIRTRSSMVGRSKIFGQTPRKKALREKHTLKLWKINNTTLCSPLLHLVIVERLTPTKLRGLSPQANYTDRATAAVGEVVPTFADRGVVRGQRNGSPRPLISVFYTGAATSSFK